MKKIIIVAIIIFIISFFLAYMRFSGQVSSLPYEEKLNVTENKPTITPIATRTLAKPEMEIDIKKTYTAVLNTSVGAITIELNTKAAPKTVNNFVYLSKNNFYDGTIFHRVIKGFMIQGGDPKGDGTGGPGYKFDDEKFSGDYKKGTVAMANSGPNTNGSQFFIMHQDYDLPKNYVIFGKVVGGLDIVNKIAEAPVGIGQMGEMSKPLSPVSVQSVEIIEK